MGTDVAPKQRGYPVTVGQFGALMAALALMIVPSPAQAGQAQLTVVRDDRQLWQSGETARENALSDMLAQGVDVVQIFVSWNQVAPEPDSLSRPSFDESDSAAYGSAALSEIDAAVRSATQKGFKVMVNPVGPAPAWASTQKGNDRFRGQYPGLAHWTRFVRALARRYSGDFDPGDGRGVVPAVRWWGIWNEPNFGAWLQPQWERSDILGRKIPRSPHLYRSLYERGAKQIRKAGARGVKLFLFDLGPVGDNRRRVRGSEKSAKTNVDPKLWLYEFFCLDKRGRPLRGKQRRARSCPRRFRSIKAYAVAHHPHTAGSTGSPMSSAGAPGLTLQNTDDLITILDRAARRKRIRSRIPVYFTEFGIRTKGSDAQRASAAFAPWPPGPGGPPPGPGGRPPGPPGPGEATYAEQAQYINEAEYLNYKQPRVRAYSQYLWVDDLVTEPGAKGWRSGLYSSDHEAKPSYDAFRLPIFVSKRGCNRVVVWGGVRPDGGSHQVEIQAGDGSSFSTVRTVTAKDGGTRYFKASISGADVCQQQWRLLWVDENGASHTGRTATPSSHR